MEPEVEFDGPARGRGQPRGQRGAGSRHSRRRRAKAKRLQVRESTVFSQCIVPNGCSRLVWPPQAEQALVDDEPAGAATSGPVPAPREVVRDVALARSGDDEPACAGVTIDPDVSRLVAEIEELHDVLESERELALTEVTTVTAEAEALQAKVDVDQRVLERFRAQLKQTFAPRMCGYSILRGTITMKCQKTGVEFTIDQLVASGTKTIDGLYTEMMRYVMVALYILVCVCVCVYIYKCTCILENMSIIILDT